MLSWLIYLMPLVLTVLCVIHAARNGNIFPWIYVIVFLPFLGSIAYVLAVILPEAMGSRGAATLQRGLRQAVDPNRGLREAHRTAGLVDSVDAKRALAEEYYSRGNYAGAVEIYRQAAQGHFADDPAILLGLARALFQTGDAAGTQQTLDRLQAADPTYVSAEAHLLYARALETQGKNEEALSEYRRLVTYYAGEEARARYAMLLEKLGQRDEARTVYKQIVSLLDGAPARYRKEQREWGDIARRALR